MKRVSRRVLNKYEKAYLKKVKRARIKQAFRQKVINTQFLLRKKISSLKKTLVSGISFVVRGIKKQQKNTYNNYKKTMVDIKKRSKERQVRKTTRPKKETTSKKRLVRKKRPINKSESDTQKTKKVVLKKRKKKSSIKPRKPKKKNRFFSWIKYLVLGFILLCLIGLGILFIWFSSLEIPSVDNFDKRKISNSTKLYDKTGEIILYDIHENIQRTVVESDKISKNAKDAIVAIEDHEFFNHNGVVWKSTFRAVVQTILSKMGISNEGPAGGSTLTQQVVKNTLLTRERTLTRKMKEWVLAYKIEKKLTKDEILTVYLNEAPYGGTIYGIQEASRVFFGKTAAELTIAEAAYLAAIPNLPTYYSPYGQNKDKLDRRQRIVLAEMKRHGYITDDIYRKALAEKVEFLGREDSHAKALHFVHYVRAILEKKYGADTVENGGLKVITTLDYKLQQKAEKIIKRHVENVEEKYNASNASLVAIEAQTGNIITMVGSRDYFDTKDFDGNFNVAISPRQPGSAFKPFAYTTAFEKGYLPESMIFDTETQFNSRCEASDTTSKNGCYSPRNHDSAFKGVLSFRNALAQSRNIPAIKVLYLADIAKVISKAKEMGISSLTKSPSYYGLGLVLGGGEVSLLEMTSAYTTLANEGEHNQANAILEITDVDGNILEKYQKNEKRVFSKNAARMISDVLSDNNARAPLFGMQSFMHFGSRDVAAKTGTTNDNRDAWLLGYTSDVAVGVWTGNNDNSPMKKGSSISGKPWREFMEEILDEYDSKRFEKYSLPDNFSSLPNMIRGEWMGGETYVIDSVSGKLATEFTPESTKISVTNFDPHTLLHTVRKNKPQESGDSQSDPQYKNWEFGVQKYAQNFYRHMYQSSDFVPPTEYDDIHTTEDVIVEADFEVDLFGLRSEYDFDENIAFDVVLGGVDKTKIKQVFYYVNNSFIGSVSQKPFRISFRPVDVEYLKTNNTIRVLVEHQDGSKAVVNDSFDVKLPENFISRQE